MIQSERREHMATPDATATTLAPGVQLRPLIDKNSGAQRLATGLADFDGDAGLPYHTHPCSEAMVVLAGRFEVIVDDRCYLLNRFDTMHIPPQVPHLVRNADANDTARMFVAFASDAPERDPAKRPGLVVRREQPLPDEPERLARFDLAEEYELAPQAMFRNLFVGRRDNPGICGGIGFFQPGAGLPCHTHDFDESITIFEGNAVCQVAGSEYELGDCSTALVPRGRPHRFFNRSNQCMAMIWVYAGDAPDRTILDACFCDGTCDIAAVPSAVAATSSSLSQPSLQVKP